MKSDNECWPPVLRYAIVMYAVLLPIQANMAVAQTPSGPNNIIQAQVAWRFDPTRRCPGLKIAEEGVAASVVFLVGTSGVPSGSSLKASSGSESLDAAAVSCISKLRFQPATRLGDGAPVESWQQIELTWAPQLLHQDRAAAIAAAAAASPNGQAAERPDIPHAEGNSVEVRVCVDAAGRLAQAPKITRSSGDPGFDQAALKIAESGSGYYRPVTKLSGKPVPGCGQVAIKFDLNDTASTSPPK
jgi:TonB family protein